MYYTYFQYNPLLTYTIRFTKMVMHPNFTGNYTIDSYREKTFVNGNFKMETTEKNMINMVSKIRLNYKYK